MKTMSKQSDTYKEIKVLSFLNMTARVHIPDLSEEERRRRMRIIKDSATRLFQKRGYTYENN